MIRRTLRWVVLVSIGVAVVSALPDLERYLKMREMSRD
jgi:hypothetical protein